MAILQDDQSKITVSGYTIVRNGLEYDYPFIESIRSILPIVDEFIVNVGDGTDKTLEKVKALQSESPKVKIIESKWPLDDPKKRKEGLILSEQSNQALSHCTGDWCFYLQADEVVHEADLHLVTSAIRSVHANSDIDGLLFDYVHFYGSYDVVQESRSAYRREVRIFRRSSSARSIGDAQSFRLDNGSKLRVAHSKARIFHYGWVRDPKAMKDKTFFLDNLYHPSTNKNRTHTGDNYRYKRFWGLKRFEGQHPCAMKARIDEKNWNWDLAASPFTWKTKDIKKVVLDSVEKLTGHRLFEYQSYKLDARPIQPKVHVVVSTYNNPESLSRCLKSLTLQSFTAFDLHIADDGSDDQTKAVIERFRPQFRTLNHRWHQDRGYHKAEINNEVFRHLPDDGITICLDHDVILHHRFIEDHVQFHRENPNSLFMGRRVELGPEVTKLLSEKDIPKFNRGLSLALLRSTARGDSRNSFRAVRIQNKLARTLLKRDDVKDLIGSNFSVPTAALKQVNGYNEEFQSYWGEDGDLFIRLRNIGLNIQGSKSVALQYHLHHKRLEPDPENQKRYQELLQDSSYVRCERGISR